MGCFFDGESASACCPSAFALSVSCKLSPITSMSLTHGCGLDQGDLTCTSKLSTRFSSFQPLLAIYSLAPQLLLLTIIIRALNTRAQTKAGPPSRLHFLYHACHSHPSIGTPCRLHGKTLVSTYRHRRRRRRISNPRRLQFPFDAGGLMRRSHLLHLHTYAPETCQCTSIIISQVIHISLFLLSSMLSYVPLPHFHHSPPPVNSP